MPRDMFGDVVTSQCLQKVAMSASAAQLANTRLKRGGGLSLHDETRIALTQLREQRCEFCWRSWT